MKTVPAGELFGEASAASPPSPSGQRMIRPRLPALTAELVALPVDVIVAGGDVAIEAARRATIAIPIVMAVASEAVARGFVQSLARPGSNVTGLSAFLPELAGKGLELLKEVLPRAGRVGVISIPSNFTGRSSNGWRSRHAPSGSNSGRST